MPKNFAQDIVVAAEILGHDAPMHKYAVQVTVADVRDGALSSSTLKEASSWGKVDTAFEQMVYSEATLAVPLIVGYAYHRGAWQRRARRLARVLPAHGTASPVARSGRLGRGRPIAAHRCSSAGAVPHASSAFAALPAKRFLPVFCAAFSAAFAPAVTRR